MLTNKKVRKQEERGMTLIELLIALTVLVIGMGAVMGMILIAIAGSNNNRQDTSGTMLSQLVIEQIAAEPGSWNPAIAVVPPVAAGTPVNPVVRDCLGNQFTIAIAGAAAPAGAGAPILAANTAFGNAGDINWTSAAVPNYSMIYTACGANGQQTPYDVRWNVQTVSTTAKLVTVSTRRRGFANTTTFSLPVTLRTIVSG